MRHIDPRDFQDIDRAGTFSNVTLRRDIDGGQQDYWLPQERAIATSAQLRRKQTAGCGQATPRTPRLQPEIAGPFLFPVVREQGSREMHAASQLPH